MVDVSHNTFAGAIESCKLTGHTADVRTFRQCYDVEIYFLNLLVPTKARNTVESYLDATDPASV